MITATLPENETERLADLRALNILDTPSEKRFDRLVHLAAHLFDVPIAYIAMVDADRQWFKSKCGLAVDETGRDVSFCGHAILQNEPLVIPDATQDERFHDNPLVIGEPHVRFYVGNSLRGPNGHNVGTLCIADTRPREVSPRDLALIRKLTEVAEHELSMVALIETQRELIRTKTQLVQVQNRQAEEIAEAVEYVNSILPQPLSDGSIRTEYEFLNCTELGGDIFGYHWLDDRCFAIYLLDACGHGVGASLLSVSAWNTLRLRTLPHVSFHDPGDVLTALNKAYPMEAHHDKFLTAWYGVYDSHTRELRYASAGHPPAVVVENGKVIPDPLGHSELVIGVEDGYVYKTERRQLTAESRLIIFSDGAYEIRNTERELLGYEGFSDLLAELSGQNNLNATNIVRQLREYQNNQDFDDDVTVLDISFTP